MSRRVLDRKKRQNGFSVALVIMVILMLMVVISFKRYELKQKQEEYTQKEEQLLEQIAEEEERAEEIEEYRKYTQTQKYIEEGQFAPGSMLPKVQAAMKFVKANPGKTAIITSLDKAIEALEGKTGTVFTL